MAVCRTVCGALLALSFVTPARAQAATSWVARLQEQDHLVALEWQRRADGALWWRDAGDAAVPAESLFPVRLDRREVDPVPIVLTLLHRGDVLSTTDAERHLQRLAVSTRTQDLLQFLRRPAGSAPAAIDELDRMVAMDLLRRAEDAEAQAARPKLCTDASLAPALRARLAPPLPTRHALDEATLSLPADADAYLMFDHAALFDALALVQFVQRYRLAAAAVGADAAEVAGTGVALGITRLRHAQVEAEAVAEFGFELTRRFGAMRFDQTVVALQFDDGLLSIEGLVLDSRGAFDPAAVQHGLLGGFGDAIRCRLDEHGLEATVAGALVTVTPDHLRVATRNWPAAARPDLARQLLSTTPNKVAARAILPTSSRLLVLLELVGIAEARRAELTLTADGPRIVASCRAEFADAEVALRLTRQSRDALRELFGHAPLPVEQDVSFEGAAADISLWVDRATLPTAASLRRDILHWVK